MQYADVAGERSSQDLFWQMPDLKRYGVDYSEYVEAVTTASQRLENH